MYEKPARERCSLDLLMVDSWEAGGAAYAEDSGAGDFHILLSQGDQNAYRRLTTYCKADCTNLQEFAAHIYRTKWDKLYTHHAKDIDFASIHGQQMTIFG